MVARAIDISELLQEFNSILHVKGYISSFAPREIFTWKGTGSVEACVSGGQGNGRLYWRDSECRIRFGIKCEDRERYRARRLQGGG